MAGFAPLQKMEMAASGLALVLGALVSFYAYHYLGVGMMISPGAGFIPFILGIALAILGACWLAATLIAMRYGDRHRALVDGLEDCPPAEESPPEFRSRKHLLGFFIILLFALLLERIGFFISVALFMFGWQMIVEKERWLKSLIITLLTAGAMYTLFRLLLKIHLPSGEWFS